MKLIPPPPEQVKRWKEVKLQGKKEDKGLFDLFNCSKLFFPYNKPGHWVLIEVDLENFKVNFLCSLHNLGKNNIDRFVVKSIVRWLHETHVTWKDTEPKFSKDINFDKDFEARPEILGHANQGRTLDCGLHMLTNAFLRASKVKNTRILGTNGAGTEMRRRVVLSIERKKLMFVPLNTERTEKRKSKSEDIEELRVAVSPKKKPKTGRVDALAKKKTATKRTKKKDLPGWYYYEKGTKLQGKNPVCAACGKEVDRRNEPRLRYVGHYTRPRVFNIMTKTLTIHCKKHCIFLLQQPRELKDDGNIQRSLFMDHNQVNKKDWPDMKSNPDIASMMEEAKKDVIAEYNYEKNQKQKDSSRSSD